MGGVESKKQIRKLVNSEIVGTEQLELLWGSCGGNESISKVQMKSLLKELTKRMKVKATDEQLEDWIEQCRSSQGKYPTDMINFLHFKRLYLATLLNSGADVTLSMSLRTLLPQCLNSLFGVSVEKATLRSHPLSILPSFVQDVCDYLNQEDIIKTEGLYRIPGFEKVIQEEIQRIDMGETVNLSQPADACGLLIKFFKYVSDGLYGPLNSNFRKLTKNFPKEERPAEFKRLIRVLPSANRELLTCLSRHYALVVEHQGPGILNLLLESANDETVFYSTVKYNISYQESAKRSNSKIPSPLKELLPFLNENASHNKNLYKVPGDSYEYRVREIIYLLHNDVSVNQFLKKGDTIAASLAVARFIETTTNSIWGDYEQELLAQINEIEEFEKVFDNLPEVHALSVLALASHIQHLAQFNHSIEEWCSMSPIVRLFKQS